MGAGAREVRKEREDRPRQFQETSRSLKGEHRRGEIISRGPLAPSSSDEQEQLLSAERRVAGGRRGSGKSEILIVSLPARGAVHYTSIRSLYRKTIILSKPSAEPHSKNEARSKKKKEKGSKRDGISRRLWSSRRQTPGGEDLPSL